jgi:hypothetical protein
MQRSSRWLIFLCFNALLLAQPALRLKVHVPANTQVNPLINPGDTIANENPIIRGARLPRLTPTHVIVQFDQPPTTDTLDALRARGAVVLQDVPDNAVLVLMNDTVVLDGLGIRSARPFDPREKISPLIANGDASAASGYYLVEFHPDVDPSDARRLILNAGVELHENPDLLRHHLMVHIPNASNARATLALLASQDQVSYIFPASANLVAGVSIAICGGALASLGPIGQLIATNGDGWDGPGLGAATLTYVFQYITAQLAAGVPQGEIVRAMGEWAKVVQITWQPGTDPLGNRTVDIFWATYAHGDGFPFDGPGGVVAHTFYPYPPNAESLAGDMHFDDSESWHVGAQVDVFSVALHELGHALGLGHSDNPNDVMYPYLKIVTGLADGDKAAILTLYAAQTGSVPPPSALALTVDVPPATTTASTISLTGTVTGGTGSPSVTWSTSTGASDGSSITGSNWVSSSIPLAIGLNTIIVTATDANGSTSHVVSVTQTGASAPGPLAVTINAPPTTTTSATISLTGTVTGGSGTPSVTWITSAGASDGSTISGGNWTIVSVPLAMGLNTITVTAADATGTVSQIVSVTRTAAPPPGPLALTINVPPATTTDATITLSGTVTGGSGSPTVHWITSTGASDGSTINAGTWTILSIPLAMGLNTITVTAADATGSVSQIVSVTRTVAALPGPLVLTINAPPTTTTALTIALSGTVTGGTGAPAVTWSNSMGSFDGTTFSGSNWTISNIPLVIGSNTITVTAADPAGSVSQIVTVIRTATASGGTDTTGPALTITYPSSTSVATMLASFTFKGTASDPSGVASVTWSTNTGQAGTALGTTQWSAVIPLLVGFNQVVIRATDTAGNVSWRSVIVTRRGLLAFEDYHR